MAPEGSPLPGEVRAGESTGTADTATAMMEDVMWDRWETSDGSGIEVPAAADPH
jgi:hypothetical protein